MLARFGITTLVGKGADEMVKKVEAFAKTPEGKEVAKEGARAGQEARRLLRTPVAAMTASNRRR